MFGLFTKKPSHEIQNSLGKQAANITQSFSYVFQHKMIPPNDGNIDNSIRLDSDEDSSLLRDRFIELINNNFLARMAFEEKTQVLNHLAKDIFLSEEPPERYLDGAVFLLTTLNSADTITRVYYRDYPEYRPLLEMVNQLAKVVVPTLEVIFHNDIPNELRQVFPHVSSLIEQYRANSNF